MGWEVSHLYWHRGLDSGLIKPEGLQTKKHQEYLVASTRSGLVSTNRYPDIPLPQLFHPDKYDIQLLLLQYCT